MADITILWSGGTTSDFTDVQDMAPEVPAEPNAEPTHTGKPIYVVPADRGYIYGLTFTLPHNQCSSTVVTNFVSHNRDLSKKVTIFDIYDNQCYYGMVVGVPPQFYVRQFPFPVGQRRMGIKIRVTREGTYTGTAGAGASITWSN